MTSKTSDNSLPDSNVRWRSLAWQATAGFLLGYAVLHPVSMIIFQWLDPRLAGPEHGGGSVGMLAPVAHSFHLSMLPMGLVFGVVGALIAAFYGYHRLMVAAQRDCLAQQAELLKHSNEELARLELASRRTSQFMAHDFKTALGCVSGHAEQLLKQSRVEQDRDVAGALVCIRRQAHVMMGGVTDLLEFARIRENRNPRMKPVAVTEVLSEAVGDFSLPMHVEQIELGDRHARCPPLTADPRLLRRVLCNLISNAIKHNGPNTRVCLDAEVDELRDECLFSCRDDGAGIPPDMLSTIFTEFAGTNEPSGESTGLGLAFCKSVVEAHGGRIWCESPQSQGAQFYFTIPLRKEPNNDS